MKFQLKNLLEKLLRNLKYKLMLTLTLLSCVDIINKSTAPTFGKVSIDYCHC